MKTAKNLISVTIVGFGLGCADSHNHDNHEHNHHGHGEGHTHKAPHGGTMVNVDNEFCHLEFVQDPLTKRLQMHVMRFHPKEGPVKFFAKEIRANTMVDGEKKSLVFKPTELDGETQTEKDTSIYVAGAEWLKPNITYDISLDSLTLEGKTFHGISFKFTAK